MTYGRVHVFVRAYTQRTRCDVYISRWHLRLMPTICRRCEIPVISERVDVPRSSRDMRYIHTSKLRMALIHHATIIISDARHTPGPTINERFLEKIFPFLLSRSLARALFPPLSLPSTLLKCLFPWKTFRNVLSTETISHVFDVCDDKRIKYTHSQQGRNRTSHFEVRCVKSRRLTTNGK